MNKSNFNEINYETESQTEEEDSSVGFSYSHSVFDEKNTYFSNLIVETSNRLRNNLNLEENKSEDENDVFSNEENEENEEIVNYQQEDMENFLKVNDSILEIDIFSLNETRRNNYNDFTKKLKIIYTQLEKKYISEDNKSQNDDNNDPNHIKTRLFTLSLYCRKSYYNTIKESIDFEIGNMVMNILFSYKSIRRLRLENLDIKLNLLLVSKILAEYENINELELNSIKTDDKTLKFVLNQFSNNNPKGLIFNMREYKKKNSFDIFLIEFLFKNKESLVFIEVNQLSNVLKINNQKLKKIICLLDKEEGEKTRKRKGKRNGDILKISSLCYTNNISLTSNNQLLRYILEYGYVNLKEVDIGLKFPTIKIKNVKLILLRLINRLTKMKKIEILKLSLPFKIDYQTSNFCVDCNEDTIDCICVEDEKSEIIENCVVSDSNITNNISKIDNSIEKRLLTTIKEYFSSLNKLKILKLNHNFNINLVNLPSKLKELCLEGNSIQIKKPFLKTLSKMTCLSYLNIRFNKIDMKDFKDLLLLLFPCNKLRLEFLFLPDLIDKSSRFLLMQYIFSMILNNQTLKYVFHRNEQFFRNISNKKLVNNLVSYVRRNRDSEFVFDF